MFLLDTNVVSGLRRRDKADPNLLSWADNTADTVLFLSAVVLEELERGILQIGQRDPAQGARFRTWMDEFILRRYADRILSIDTSIALIAAGLQVPNPRPYRDTFIAATAHHHNLTLVTRNVRDFAGTGIHVLNPFEPESRSILP